MKIAKTSFDAAAPVELSRSRTVDEFIADANGVAGVLLLTGPDVVAGPGGLPGESAYCAMVAGAMLIARSLMMHSLIRRGGAL